VTADIIDAAMKAHTAVGPGLLETTYSLSSAILRALRGEIFFFGE